MDSETFNTTPPTTEMIKVLVADDDAPTRILLRAAISQWHYEVIEACDGEEVWDILQQSHAPRLIILDWLMPKLDGLTLCTRIKQELSYHPYIILLTQLSGASNIIKALDAGANEFLSKPFNMAELRSRLSVGERIIRLEEQVSDQKKLLQPYILQIENFKSLILDLPQEIRDAITLINEVVDTCETNANKEKLQALSNNLKSLINFINNYQSKLNI